MSSCFRFLCFIAVRAGLVPPRLNRGERALSKSSIAPLRISNAVA